MPHPGVLRRRPAPLASDREPHGRVVGRGDRQAAHPAAGPSRGSFTRWRSPRPGPRVQCPAETTEQQSSGTSPRRNRSTTLPATTGSHGAGMLAPKDGKLLATGDGWVTGTAPGSQRGPDPPLEPGRRALVRQFTGHLHNVHRPRIFARTARGWRRPASTPRFPGLGSGPYRGIGSSRSAVWDGTRSTGLLSRTAGYRSWATRTASWACSGPTRDRRCRKPRNAPGGPSPPNLPGVIRRRWPVGDFRGVGRPNRCAIPNLGRRERPRGPVGPDPRRGFRFRQLPGRKCDIQRLVRPFPCVLPRWGRRRQGRRAGAGAGHPVVGPQDG